MAVACPAFRIHQILNSLTAHPTNGWVQPLRQCHHLPILHCLIHPCGKPKRMIASAVIAIAVKQWWTRTVRDLIHFVHFAHRALALIDVISVKNHRAARNARRTMIKSWSIALKMPVEAANALAPVEPWAAIANPSNSGEFHLMCNICIGQSGKLLNRSSSSSNSVRSLFSLQSFVFCYLN